MDARQTALSALIACRKQGGWSDGVLKEYCRRDRLDRREAALATRLCYGVLQNRMLLDFYLGEFLNGGWKRLQPVVPDILRLGAYQVLFLDRVPVSAAVNEAVEQGKRYANAKAAGLINGVLRNLVRHRARLPQPPDLATKYSHPQALVHLLADAVGKDEVEKLLQSDNEAPPVTVQCNPLRCDVKQLSAALERAGVSHKLHPWLQDCLILTGTGSIEQLTPFQEGWFIVQDPAANLAVRCAGLQPGMRVLDCCAAPGGKSFAAAILMQDTGHIDACDLHDHKIGLIGAGAKRLGLSSIAAQQQDAAVRRPDWVGQMDAVLADVPCSGLGVIRKKPDIRYKPLEMLAGLPDVQKKILETQADYVKPGGVLLYSTCTILPRENEAVTDWFLQTHPMFEAEPLALPAPLSDHQSGRVTLLPSRDGTDGFYICKLRRKP